MSPASNAADPAIRHRPERRRFELALNPGEPAGELDYRLVDPPPGAAPPVMEILHTGVSPQFQGRGLAAHLTRAALDHARAHGWKVQPQCSYARSYFRRHPEQADLLA